MKAPRQPKPSMAASASVAGPSRSPTEAQAFIRARVLPSASSARSTSATSEACTKASLAAPQANAAISNTGSEWPTPKTIIASP